MRKHEWESTTKKASNRYIKSFSKQLKSDNKDYLICFVYSNRSWDKVYTVLKGGFLLFYKDQKNFKTQADAYFRGENPIELSSGTVEVAADYTKKKHVFRLKYVLFCLKKIFHLN
jgi:spectrin beta